MYEVKVLPSAQRDLDALERADLNRVKARLLELRGDPRPVGTQKLTADEGYRVRVGDYRILYRIDDRAKTVYIYRVKHRRDAYR